MSLFEGFPADFASTDPEQLATYGRDWTRAVAPNASAVVFPRSTEEVSRFLRRCQDERVAVVPSGGRTGLAGGAVAAHGEVVLSLERMNHIGEVEPLGLTLNVGAGAVTQAVHEHCRPLGLTWPIDLAAKGSSQIGGNLATNAGGVRVIRYGHARNWVAGLVAVLMDGSILRLGGALQKNNTGPDLRQLFVGSEGILGVITEATLKLAPIPESTEVLLFAVSGIEAALALLRHARLEGRLELLAFEFLMSNCLEAVVKVQGRARPFAEAAPAYVLVEVEATHSERVEAWLEAVLMAELVNDGVMARTSAEKAQLWGYRENITESLGSLGTMWKNDVSVEVPKLPAFVEGLLARSDEYPGEVFLFGHLGDGNLHVNVMKPAEMPAEEFYTAVRPADQALYELLQRLHGSVAAEHGIGLLKKWALPYSRTPEELAAFRGLKKALDPLGLLNPGKIFD